MNSKNYKAMPTRTSVTLLSVGLVLLLSGCGGSSKTAINTPTPTPIPEYPPMYHVKVEVCGYARNQPCEIANSRVWGPVGEVKLVNTDLLELPSSSSYQHKLAISSRGCYPQYERPDRQQFYWGGLLRASREERYSSSQS